MVTTPSFLNQIPDNPPAPVVLNQTKFDRGVVSVVDQSNLPRNALKEADNITLVEDGAPQPRPGVDYYGTDLGGTIRGGKMHVMPDETIHLIVAVEIAGIVYIKRSTNDGVTWTQCTGATLTAGKPCDFEQANAFTFIGNGEDHIIRYDGTTVLVPYTGLTTPVGNAPTKTGLAGTTYTYRYRVTAFNEVGNTIASTAQTVQVDRLRSSFDASNFVIFTWGAVAGASGYNIYVGQVLNQEVFIDTVDGQTNTTYTDQGSAVEQTDILAPDSDTTSGPKAGSLTMVGTRLHATRDKDFPFRDWISGAGRFVGQFGSTTEATYIDFGLGGQERPQRVEDYRDGKGTPLATVWCKSADGRGSIWQGTLEDFTIGTITFPVPNFNKIPGSRGTNSPFGVVNVNNDYVYPNSQAFYNLGSRAQFLNLLSTDESSVNIRPDVRAINFAASDKIAAYHSPITGKVFLSVPTDGSTVNNVTMLFDTEHKAWLPRAFTIGFERLFDHTDASKVQHLLCWKPGDTRLSEISADIKGDYGAAFSTSLISGLQHYNPKNRADFIEVDDAFVEFANPKGDITVELSAIVRDEGFGVVDTVVITPDSTLHGWSTARWSTKRWSSVPAAVSVFAEPSMKRYFSVQEDINAYQFRISTNAVDADFILRTLQIEGTQTGAGKDTAWEVTPS